MRLRSFSINQFKSIKNLVMDDIGDLNILVGKNDSGKSNILDAIRVFLSGFEFNQDFKSPTKLVDLMWPYLNATSPIICTSSILFYKSDFGSYNSGDLGEMLTKLGTDKEIMVRIKRHLNHESKEWSTEELFLHDVCIVKEFEVVQDFESSAKRLFEFLCNFLKNSVQKVDINRGITSEDPSFEQSGLRQAIIPVSTLEKISNWTSIISYPNTENLKVLGLFFNDFFPDYKIEQRGPQLCLTNDRISSPIYTVGGGVQDLLHMALNLSERPEIMMVEEPDRHVHPSLARKLYKKYRDASFFIQTFLTTHSTSFIDQAALADIWLVEKVNDDEGRKYTSCRKLNPEGELEKIVTTLGILPSHACMTSSLLFVEGPSEQIIIESWARQLDIPLYPPYTCIVQMESKDKSKHKALTWKPVIELLKMPTFWLFDDDMEDREIDELKIILRNSKFEIRKLDKSIEDHYPEDPLYDHLISEYQLLRFEETENIEIKDRLKKVVEENNRVPEINYILMKWGDPQQSKDGWKVPLANAMKKTTVPDSIKLILIELKKYLDQLT